MSETIEILKAARERLFEKGWMKSGFGDEYGPNCVLGAVEQVCWKMDSYYDYTVELLLESVCPAETNVIFFNDHPETSFDDIINLIDLAIKKEEERAN